MPMFVVNTNLPADKIPANWVKDTVEVVANALGKPSSYCVVQIIPNQLMSWGTLAVNSN